MLPKNAIAGSIGAIGTVMIGAAGVGPDQAKSNLESWAALFKLDSLVPLVQGPSADTIAMAVGIALVILSVIFFVASKWRSLFTLGSISTAAQQGSGPVSSAKIIVLPPKQRYSITWDPPKSLQIITMPEIIGDGDYHKRTRLPVLQLKNIGNEVATNIKIIWQIHLGRPLPELVAQSKRVQPYNFTIEAGNAYGFTVHHDTGSQSWGHGYSEKAQTLLPYLAPSIDNETYVDLDIPSHLWAAVELYCVACLPEIILDYSPAEKKSLLPPMRDATLPLLLTLSISYDNIDAPKEQKFICEIRNVRPASTGIVQIPEDGKMRVPPIVMASASIRLIMK